MQGGSRGFESPRLHQPAPRADGRTSHQRDTQPRRAAAGGVLGGSEALPAGTFTTEERTSAKQATRNTVGVLRRAGNRRPARGPSRPAGRAWRQLRSRECLTKGQATKGARRMPRRHGPMKDVARLRKAPASCLASSTGDLRMGQPGPLHRGSRPAEHIGRIEGTGGTETSQYPEEKKRFP